jgi:hypothetical protein
MLVEVAGCVSLISYFWRQFMKTLSLLLVCMFLATVCVAQQSPADRPPTKQEIAKYFEIMHVREGMKSILESVAKETKQLIHEQLKREAPNGIPEFNAQVDAMLALDGATENQLVEEMLTNIVPVYQKHFAKGDLAALLAFYDTPRGQRLRREVPTVTQESMQATQVFMQRKTNAIMQQVHEQIIKIQKEAKPKTDQPAAPSTPPASPAPSPN